MPEFGRGSPVVVVPGIQGRWQWMRPALEALGRRHRVLTFSLSDVRGPGLFDRWVDQIDTLLDQASEARAAVVGVSFGGLVAVHYASRRPLRASSLVLVSTPAPECRLDPQTARYAAHPHIALPLFALRGVRRLAPEIGAAHDSWPARLGAAARHSLRVVTAPPAPGQMAAWVREWAATDIAADCSAIAVPTLLLTGEPHLDRVVPVADSLEYLRRIPGARHTTLPGTGHLGLVLKSDAFAECVSAFIGHSPE